MEPGAHYTKHLKPKTFVSFIQFGTYKNFRLNPIALRMAKTLWSFGRSVCNRVKICCEMGSGW